MGLRFAVILAVGARNLFEADRIEGVKRIVFASSYHAMGFYRHNETIDHTHFPRPESRYGLSKVFGEALGSLYADKYGTEVMAIRIGNVAEEPLDSLPTEHLDQPPRPGPAHFHRSGASRHPLRGGLWHVGQ